MTSFYAATKLNNGNLYLTTIPSDWLIRLADMDQGELECALDDLSNGDVALTYVINHIDQINKCSAYGLVLGTSLIDGVVAIGIGQEKRDALINLTIIEHNMDLEDDWDGENDIG